MCVPAERFCHEYWRTSNLDVHCCVYILLDLGHIVEGMNSVPIHDRHFLRDFSNFTSKTEKAL